MLGPQPYPPDPDGFIEDELDTWDAEDLVVGYAEEEELEIREELEEEDEMVWLP